MSTKTPSDSFMVKLSSGETLCPIDKVWCKMCGGRPCKHERAKTDMSRPVMKMDGRRTELLHSNMKFWLYYLDHGLPIDGDGMRGILRNDVIAIIELLSKLCVTQTLDELEALLRKVETKEDKAGLMQQAIDAARTAAKRELERERKEPGVAEAIRKATERLRAKEEGIMRDLEEMARNAAHRPRLSEDEVRCPADKTWCTECVVRVRGMGGGQVYCRDMQTILGINHLVATLPRDGGLATKQNIEEQERREDRNKPADKVYHCRSCGLASPSVCPIGHPFDCFLGVAGRASTSTPPEGAKGEPVFTSTPSTMCPVSGVPCARCHELAKGGPVYCQASFAQGGLVKDADQFKRTTHGEHVHESIRVDPATRIAQQRTNNQERPDGGPPAQQQNERGR